MGVTVASMVSPAAAAAPAPAEFVACILATQVGARLVPVASSGVMPKHMLPIAGIPLLFRLLSSLETTGFSETVVVIHPDDKVTLQALLGTTDATDATTPHPYKLLPLKRNASSSTRGDQATGSNDNENIDSNEDAASSQLVFQSSKMKLTLLTLTSSSLETAEAVRRVEESGVVPTSSHLLVLPGDLLILDPTAKALRDMIHAHRMRGWTWNNSVYSAHATGTTILPLTACTVLLTDVGAVDEKGHPLKESAKQRKGILSRDEEEIDYMAVTDDNQLLWKQQKLDVEDDKEMVGSTPKLVFPKARLRCPGGGTRIRTEWNDVHCYCLAPWVRRMLVLKPSLQSIRYDLLSLLIARQFRGAEATFGTSIGRDVVLEALAQTFPGGVSSDHFVPPTLPLSPLSQGNTDSHKTPPRQREYRVFAHITDSSVIRVNSIVAYSYANREFMHAVATKGPSTVSVAQAAQYRTSLGLPDGASFNSKFQSIVLTDCKVADKVTFKSSVVGSFCVLGANCRLNNVVLHNNVTVGEQTILQNTIVCANSKIGENCNLNDCQVGAKTTIPAGTKAKGEAFTLPLL